MGVGVRCTEEWDGADVSGAALCRGPWRTTREISPSPQQHLLSAHMTVSVKDRVP